MDVRDLTFDSMRETLGMVTQDGHLFHESIASNLRLARPDASEELMWDVLRQARLEDMIRSLPDGLDTVVGERGYRLSGGERQRLTIARLLIAQPRVVILDEATAALDSTNEAAVQEALGAALEGRTAVVIAHRLSTIRAADAILVVEDGVIVERGTHSELLAAEGRYAELYRTQFAEATAVAAEAVPELSPAVPALGPGPALGRPSRAAARSGSTWSVSSGARSSGSSPARSSQRISAISADGARGPGARGAVKTVASICVAASLAASASQLPRGSRSSGGSDDADFLRQFPGRGLRRGFAGLGLAAGVHELVRAALADGEQPAGGVKDADGGDHDVRVGAVLRPGSRCSTDSSSRSLAGPVTSQRVAEVVRTEPGVADPVRVRIAPVAVLAGLSARSPSGGRGGRREEHVHRVRVLRRAGAGTRGWPGR